MNKVRSSLWSVSDHCNAQCGNSLFCRKNISWNQLFSKKFLSRNFFCRKERKYNISVISTLCNAYNIGFKGTSAWICWVVETIANSTVLGEAQKKDIYLTLIPINEESFFFFRHFESTVFFNQIEFYCLSKMQYVIPKSWIENR